MVPFGYSFRKRSTGLRKWKLIFENETFKIFAEQSSSGKFAFWERIYFSLLLYQRQDMHWLIGASLVSISYLSHIGIVCFIHGIVSSLEYPSVKEIDKNILFYSSNPLFRFLRFFANKKYNLKYMKFLYQRSFFAVFAPRIVRNIVSK